MEVIVVKSKKKKKNTGKGGVKEYGAKRKI